jgi:hypothetical protein
MVNIWLMFVCKYHHSLHVSSCRYAHYDNVASFSDYSSYSFGCWTSPFAKQYYGTTSVCGASIDKNYATDFSKYNTNGTCSHLGYYCGNDGLGLDANNLYYCSGSGATPKLSTDCAFTCVTMPSGYDDKCSTSGSCSAVNTG